MALSKAQKAKVIRDVTERLGAAEIVIVTKNQGMTVAEVTELRSKARASGASYKVAKNHLVKRVLPETPFGLIEGHLKGPTAITTSKDAVAAAKTIVEYAKKNEKLVIVGGAFGEKALDVKGIEQLATLPSLDELRGKIVGLLQAPAQRIATVLQAPAAQLARVTSAYAKKES